MSLYDYQKSQGVELRQCPFYALIMAAMRGADTDNLDKLRAAFPEVYRELRERYNAPGGQIPTDTN